MSGPGCLGPVVWALSSGPVHPGRATQHCCAGPTGRRPPDAGPGLRARGMTLQGAPPVSDDPAITLPPSLSRQRPWHDLAGPSRDRGGYPKPCDVGGRDRQTSLCDALPVALDPACEALCGYLCLQRLEASPGRAPFRAHARRARPLAHEDAVGLIRTWGRFGVADITQTRLKAGLAVRASAQLSLRDALIVAAGAGREELTTEYLNSGQDIAGVRVVSPFLRWPLPAFAPSCIGPFMHWPLHALAPSCI